MSNLGAIDVEVRAELQAFEADLARARQLANDFDRSINNNVEVQADLASLESTLAEGRAEFQAFQQALSQELEVDADILPFRARIGEAEQEILSLQQSGLREVPISADASDVRSEVTFAEAQIDQLRNQPPVNIPLSVNDNQLRSTIVEAQSALASLNQTDVAAILIRGDASDLRTTIEQARSELGSLANLRSSEVLIDGDASGLLSTINQARAEISSIQNLALQEVQIDGDASGLVSQIDLATTSLNQFRQNSNVKVLLDVDGFDELTRLSSTFTEFQRNSAAAAASVQPLENELNELRARFDPIFAASQRYEQELEELNRAHQLGAVNVQQYGSALTDLNTRYQSLTQRQQVATRGLRSLFGSFSGRNNFIIQNTANQFGDFAVQVSSGTDAVRALGQQLPQLLGGLGGLGAVLGAVAAISIPIVGTFLRLGEEAEEAGDVIENLSGAVDDYVSSAEASSRSTRELREQYGSAAVAARELLDAQTELSRVAALETLEEAVSRVSSQFANFTEILRDAEQAASLGNAGPRAAALQNTFLTNLDNSLQSLSDRFKITEEDSRSLAESLSQLSEARGPQNVANAVNDIQRLLKEAGVNTEDLSSETQKWLRELNDVGLSAAEAQGNIDGSVRSLSAATAEANRLADAFVEISSLLDDISARSANALATSELRLEFRTDPVGLAGALERFEAERRVNEQLRERGLTLQDLDRTERAFFQRQINQNVSQAEATAQNLETIRELNAEDRRREALARRTGRRSITQRQREIQGFEDLLDRIQRQTEATRQLTLVQGQLNPLAADYQRNLDEARKASELLTAAQQANIAITPELQAEIDRLSSAYANATDEARRLTQQQEDTVRRTKEAAQFTASTISGAFTDFFGGLRQGETVLESLRNTAINVFDSIAQRLLDIAVQNLVEQAFGLGSSGGGSTFGGGGGGFLGGLFAGFFAEGGQIPAGQFGVTSEFNQPELVNGSLTTQPTLVEGPATVKPVSDLIQPVSVVAGSQTAAANNRANDNEALITELRAVRQAVQESMSVNIVNSLSPEDIVEQAAMTPRGERAIVNIMSRNSSAVT